MPLIIIVSGEAFDEAKGEFITVDEVTLELEHSLVSLSKWESIHNKPFLGPGAKTSKEILDYIEAMVISDNFSMEVVANLSKENTDKINDYISSNQSATTFNDPRKSSSRSEVITSELIYYWMTAYQIPFECECWHLNRLFALIQICNIKNSKQTNMPKSEAAAAQRSLNESRKAALGTKG